MRFNMKSLMLFEQELAIDWGKNNTTVISYKQLRKLCPCAMCSGETDALGNQYGGQQQISVDKIICSNYAKLFLNNKPGENICEIGYNLNKGFNKQEVVIIPKKVEKKGFFEKLFHFFK